MVHIKYKIWFALKLEVEDYTGDVFDFLDLVPTERCIQNIEKARIIVKKQPNVINHLIEVNADGPDVDKPVFTPIETVVFKYQLITKGNRIYTISNIDNLDVNNYRLYLSNNTNNKIGSTLYTNRTGSTATNDDRVFRDSVETSEQGAIAVIDIYQNNLVAADFRLRDGAGKSREPVFVIRLGKHP